MNNQLLVLGCSQTKRLCDGLLPAIDRYDGSPYRVLRNFLRSYEWPSNLSIGVLSAKHGLFGVLKGIENYDTKMSRSRAQAQAPECSAILTEWASSHGRIHLSLGKTYLPALRPALDTLGDRANLLRGPIGMKLKQIKDVLEGTALSPRKKVEVEPGTGRITYLLPDWDDLLDSDFNFIKDSFSKPTRALRSDKHCCRLMKPQKICDGILVSLAQRFTTKGPLRRIEGTEVEALSPAPLRRQFGLEAGQWLFGDCGAFSYVNEDEPAISVEQAFSLYEVYGFDFGASVDHIPARYVTKNGVRIQLSDAERQNRVKLTRSNAALFMDLAKERRASFNPVGTIQAIHAAGYAEAVNHYYQLGYRHLAIGGLVPLVDTEIAAIAKAVVETASKLPVRPWIHLFGVFRPKLQNLFRELKIDSFDSASYFRKAWLRSDQNYLSSDGKWYAAIRVPQTSDGRIRKRIENGTATLETLEQEEREALRLLAEYDRDQASIGDVLEAVLAYDTHLTRSSDVQSMRARYQKTLEDRPWKKCACNFCRDIGIHMLIFRGANRNKRRGAHNTMMLYGSLSKDGHGK